MALPQMKPLLLLLAAVESCMRHCFLRSRRGHEMAVLTFSFCTSKAFYPIVVLHLVQLVTDVGSATGEIESRMENGRYLVYPPPGGVAGTKVQLIIGLGLPMEVDVSMIIGYVMKYNYVLPYNASYLSHPYGLRYQRSIDPRSILDNGGKQEKGVEEEEEEEEAKRQEIPIAEGKTRGSNSRWEIYRIIESALDSFQLSGKGCLLKTVCQLARVPFDDSRAGLVTQLIRVLLTPSTTWEKYQCSGDQEYRAAEDAGRNNRGKCEELFPECGQDLLQYFTEIDDN